MSKIYVQQPAYVLHSTASLVATGSVSGSLISQGYSKLRGMFYSSMSAAGGTGSGLHILQSSDYGINWDIISASYPVKAVTASAMEVDIVGNAVKVQTWTGASAASVLRASFYLLPI